jgi:hypothetical protein
VQADPAGRRTQATRFKVAVNHDGRANLEYSTKESAFAAASLAIREGA